MSFPGTTANVFWRRATLASHARSDFAATATRCSPREPTFGARATMGCGGLEKSARVQRRMEYTWSDLLTTRGRSSFLSLRRAIRPQRGPYEVLGASRSTKPARSHFFPSCRRRHLRGDWVETQSIPWQVCLFSKSLVLLTFLKLRRRKEASLLFPRVVMTSDWKGSRPSHLMIIPNTKRHLNNTKTDQLPI